MRFLGWFLPLLAAAPLLGAAAPISDNDQRLVGRDDDDDGYPYKAGDKDCVVNAAPHSDKKKGGLHRYRIEFSSEGLSDEDTRLFCTFFYELAGDYHGGSDRECFYSTTEKLWFADASHVAGPLGSSESHDVRTESIDRWIQHTGCRTGNMPNFQEKQAADEKAAEEKKKKEEEEKKREEAIELKLGGVLPRPDIGVIV